jgi:hypothetical protein
MKEKFRVEILNDPVNDEFMAEISYEDEYILTVQPDSDLDKIFVKFFDGVTGNSASKKNIDFFELVELVFHVTLELKPDLAGKKIKKICLDMTQPK